MSSFVRFVAGGIALALAASAYAHDYTKGSLRIDHPWSRATHHVAQGAGGYFVIENTGTDADRLVRITSEISGRVEIHEMTVQDGIMKMRPLARGLEHKPGATVRFEPGGYHVIVMALHPRLKQSRSFTGGCAMERPGPLEVEFDVE